MRDSTGYDGGVSVPVVVETSPIVHSLFIRS